MTTSFDWIAHYAATRPTKTAMIDLATDRTFTWADMEYRTSRFASALEGDFGIGIGDRVMVIAHNNTNFFEVQFACWKLGAIFVPVNWRLTLSELTFIATDCDPKLIVHDREFAAMARDLADAASIPNRIDWDASDADAASYEDAIAAADPSAYRAAENTLDTVLTIMYTSGTTGLPKGAQITQGMTFYNAVNCVEFYRLHESMTNLAFLPLFHTGGLNVFANPCFHFGGRNIVMRTFDPAEALRLLSDPDVGVTHFIGVPANFLFMSQVPEFESASFPTIEGASVGGSPTPVPLLETWGERGLALQQAFGMTETSPLVCALTAEDCETKIGSAGLPALHTAVRVVDDEGNDLGPNETGELWVRGPNVTPGYWNRPEANADSFTDGWLHTGDAAVIDDDGYIYIVDRWKDMYISGGENVYPAEVENVIYQLPAIGEVAVIGVPDDKWVEVGRAIVVVKDGEAVDELTIINHCREHLARFKVPQSVIFVDEIPHNATGKVLKRVLRESHGAM